MLIQYEFYPLKEGCVYPFVNGEYSEIIYDMTNPEIFDIVDGNNIEIKSISKLLEIGYFDQYNKQSILDIFTSPSVYFLYNEEQEKYCAMFMFTDEEKATFSENFQSILTRYDCIVSENPGYISIDDISKLDQMEEPYYTKTFWLYTLSFHKGLLDSIN